MWTFKLKVHEGADNFPDEYCTKKPLEDTMVQLITHIRTCTIIWNNAHRSQILTNHCRTWNKRQVYMSYTNMKGNARIY